MINNKNMREKLSGFLLTLPADKSVKIVGSIQKIVVLNKVLATIIYQISLFSIRYIKNLPLVFLLTDILVIALIMTTGLSLQTQIIKLIAFTLNINQPDFALSKKDIVTFFAIWTIPVTIFMEIFRKITKIKTNALVVLTFTVFILSTLHIFLAFYLGSIIIPIIMFVFSFLSLLLYHFLSTIEKRMFELRDLVK